MKGRPILVAIATALVLVMSSVVMAAPPQGKVLVFHNTGSAKNPGVPIEISVDALPVHLAHGDELVIDADGTATPGHGGRKDVEATFGDTLTSWPTSGWVEGIGWFDNDWDLVSPRTWTMGDDLHVEDQATHPGANRNDIHNCPPGLFWDPTVIDYDGSFRDGQLVDVDLETGWDFAGASGPDPAMKFFDSNNNGFWDDGEDIVLDSDSDGTVG